MQREFTSLSTPSAPQSFLLLVFLFPLPNHNARAPAPQHTFAARVDGPTQSGCADACVAGESPPDICWARARWCWRRCSRQMRVAARIADACDLQMQLPPMAHGARAAAAAPARTDRLTLFVATTYVGKIDVELDPPAKPTLQPPAYRGTEVLGPTAVRCRAPLIHGTHATVARTDGKSTSRRAHAPHMTQTNGSGSTILAFRFRSLLRWPQGPPYQLSLTNPIRILGLTSDR